jgi:hypothetical protein
MLPTSSGDHRISNAFWEIVEINDHDEFHETVEHLLSLVGSPCETARRMAS